MSGRSVPEWVGKTPDTVPPKTVRARVFRAYDGHCYLSKKKILVGDEWDLEHIKPLHSAGPDENLNRESNLAPALKKPHAEKTARENSAKAKADRVHAKHFGYWPESRAKLRGRGFPRTRSA
jgi:5-methylcytosine-specific restriction protein A